MKIFTDEEWEHLASKINWKSSFLDARAIRIMNTPVIEISKIKENIKLALYGAGCTKDYCEKQTKELIEMFYKCEPSQNDE